MTMDAGAQGSRQSRAIDGIQPWIALAEAVAPAGPDAIARLRLVLDTLGLTSRQRRLLGKAVEGRTDAAGQLLADVVALAADAGDTAEDAEADLVETVADALMGVAEEPSFRASATLVAGAARAVARSDATSVITTLENLLTPPTSGAEPGADSPPVSMPLLPVPTTSWEDRVAGSPPPSTPLPMPPTSGAEPGAASPPASMPLPMPPISWAEQPVVVRSGETTTTAVKPAYPRIDVESGTTRPDVVLADEEFTVTVGLGRRRSSSLVGTGTITADEGTTVDLVVVYDPATLAVTGGTRHTLTVTEKDRYPTVTLKVTAPWIDRGPQKRRLGVHYLVDGRIVALAWRTIIVADDVKAVARAQEPLAAQPPELDLAPLVGWEAPDLVISVVQADSSERDWVWSAFASSPDIVVPDGPTTSTLGDEIAGFALDLRRSLQFSADPVRDFFDLAGRGRLIGRAVPTAIQAALRAALAHDATTAPTVLLMTEELTVPWELAVFEPELTSTPGGTSPFLGAHVALARWPLGDGMARTPPTQIAVQDGAVVTADYTGVAGWGKLDSAIAEGAAVAAMFKAAQVQPDYLTILDLLRGQPAADVIHVALHGRYDPGGVDGGIVLVARSDTGAAASILTPNAASNGELDRGPFVFLNACQVGADQTVLGSYSGFASTLLGIGAGGVIAPLWNVDDVIADALARQFYAATWEADAPAGVAEALRAVRAAYTEKAVRAGDRTVGATTVAYQVFGHPGLRLAKP